MDFVNQTINILADLLVTLLVLRAILSWVVQDQRHPLNVWLMEATEPILKPIRRLLPQMSMVDWSPLIALLLIRLIQDILNSLL